MPFGDAAWWRREADHYMKRGDVFEAEIERLRLALYELRDHHFGGQHDCPRATFGAAKDVLLKRHREVIALADEALGEWAPHPLPKEKP